MKRISIMSLALAIATLISACGGQTAAEPTISPEDIQATAVAAAFTIVAETQAAIPTNTPIPPTETPTQTSMPTDTLVPTIAATNTYTPEPCAGVLNLGGAGPTHDTLIKNKTGGTIILSLTLYTPNDFGTCGAYPSVPDSGLIGLPSGYWYAYAYITLKNGRQTSASTSFFVQPAQFDKIELCVREDTIVYSPSC